MKIIVAPDSFKGNLSSSEACSIIEAGILRADSEAVVIKIPLADGGEGTARVITLAAGGRFIKADVTDPLGRKIKAEFGLINNDKTAVLDVASASGLDLLNKNEQNPMKTTSYGTGELIAAALDIGAKEIIIGIGGSATNDGGIGMISALGFEILDKNGSPVGNGGEALTKIASINCEKADKRLKNIQIKVACDVNNPLLGSNGASAVFGPQKGASVDMIKELENGLEKLKKAWIIAGLTDDIEQVGDGAAGGIGAALRICLNANIESGAMLVMKNTGFFSHLAESDLIITGEGMTDAQTLNGKLCSVVAREGRKAGIPVALISGALGGDRAKLLSIFDYAVSIACGQNDFDTMIKDSRQDLCFAAENLVRAVKIGLKNRV